MPAHLGYICALLYNQNNCAAEASTVTTSFELEVGTDLCVMMGYDRDRSMGHLATGGSVANIEAIWANYLTVLFCYTSTSMLFIHTVIGKTTE